jgi:hypothetical protein
MAEKYFQGPHLNGYFKLALTIQLIEHNQLSAEDANEAEIIDHDIAHSKTHFIAVISRSKTLNKCFKE